MFSDGPKHFWIDGIAIFGNWGDDAILDQRVCFTFRMWTVAGINNVGLIDAAESPWHDSTLGRLLTRAQALEHPLKQQLFGLTDQIAVRDQRVVEFLEANSLPHAPNAQH
jgi:hypothetical protein